MIPFKQSTVFGSARAMAAAAATLLALSVAAQVNARGDTGLDASRNTAQERAWCMANTVDVARVDCLKEAGAAQAEKRRGTLDTNTGSYGANAVERCDVFEGTERVACQARVVGYGNASGSVQGGGVIKQIETVEVPAGAAAVVIEPSTSGRVVVVPGEQR